MKKMPTLFKKNPDNLALVTHEIDPQNQWAFDGEGICSIKYDGTACAILGGMVYKRYDAKKGKTPPTGAIPCQGPDTITGHWPHWVLCDINNSSDKYFFEGYNNSLNAGYIKVWDSTYELCGPKIGRNKERLTNHLLLPHGLIQIKLPSITYEAIKKYFEDDLDIEGLIFCHNDGRMCKIRRVDFGMKW